MRRLRRRGGPRRAHALVRASRPLYAEPKPEDFCGAALGRLHDYTMKGPDGVYRCWYCCKRPPEKV